jgi:DNA-binding protein YbaB
MADSEENHLLDLGRRATAALAAYRTRVGELATEQTTGGGDGEVAVRVNGAAALLEIRLPDAVLRRSDTAALSTLVTRAIREAQQRATAQYRKAVAAIDLHDVENLKAALHDHQHK